MYYWQITKYNPINRDENGKYLKDEWTSISDIGRKYNGVEFTLDDYLSVEQLYVDAVIGFMKGLNIQFLKVCKLEKRFSLEKISGFHQNFEDFHPKSMLDLFNSIKNDDILNTQQVEDVCKLILREHLWCELRDDESLLTIRFGYDYYMYINSLSECKNIIEQIAVSKLFVEPYDGTNSDYD